MFDGEYLILCSGKSSDPNGNITLSGIFDGVFAPSFPTVHPHMLVTSQLTAKKAIVKTPLALKLEIEIENEVISNPTLTQEVTVEKDNGVSFDFNLQNVVFPKQGKYYFKLYIDDKLYLTRVLRVRPTSDIQEA